MHILHYLRSINEEEGGVVRSVLDLTHSLAARGTRVSLFSRHALAPSSDNLTTAGDRPHVLRAGRSFGAWLTRRSLLGLKEYIADADVIHLHQLWDPSCWQVAQLATQMRIPYVITLHGVLDEWCMAHKALKKRAYLRLKGRQILESAAMVHCTAEAEREQSARWFGTERVVVLPYVTDLTPYQELPGPELAQKSYPKVFDGSGHSVALFLSRIHPKKGLERLLHAVAMLLRKQVNIELVVAGTGDERYRQRLLKLAQQLGIADNVHFVGFVRGQEKLSLYQAVDVFVLPTNQENWGLVLTESLACGTPVVTTRGTDIWRELIASEGAKITDMTPEATAAALAELLSDSQQRQRMSQRGRRWVFSNLDLNYVVSRYEQLYEQVASSSRAMPSAA